MSTRHSLNQLLIACTVLFGATTSLAAPQSAESAVAEAGKTKTYAVLVIGAAGDSVAMKAMADTVRAYGKASQKTVVLYQTSLQNQTDAAVLAKYRIDARQPMPTALVVAHNGAVTGGYPRSVTREQLKTSMSVSELTLKALKPLQEQKITLVALQNASTKSNAESWKAVTEFGADPQFGKFVGAIKADPTAAGSQEFLTQCGLQKDMAEATVVVLLPPASVGKILTGKITKHDILKSIQSCAPGCGSAGCSDTRFKQGVEPIDSALAKVSQLQGVRYQWDRAAHPFRGFTGESQIGLIAQDVERVVPEVVLTDSAGYKYVYYDKLTAVLVEAVKELKQLVNTQDSVIAAQSARIESLETAR